MLGVARLLPEQAPNLIANVREKVRADFPNIAQPGED